MGMVLLAACLATWTLVALLLRAAAPRLVAALANGAPTPGHRPWRPALMQPLQAHRPAVAARQTPPGSGRAPNRAFSRACDRAASGMLAA